MSTLQPHGRKDSCRHKQFFLICLSHDSLVNYYKTNFQLMQQDLIAASEFIDGVPKGDMVSPQIQELYMLVEYLAESTEKLKEQMESEIPLILKNEMVIQFHEERLIDLEERKNGTH